MTSAPRSSPDIPPAMLRTLAELRPLCETLARDYTRAWGIRCLLSDTHGHVIAGLDECVAGCESSADCAASRRRAIKESVRWGEPHVSLCPAGHMIWAVPVMENAVLLGGLVAGEAVATTTPPAGQPEPRRLSPAEVRTAAFDLLARAEETNLTNAALLELRRTAARREAQRAEAIHAVKDRNYQSIRDLYLIEEPGLLAAIKRGDKAAARETINRVLVGIYFMARERPLLLKSFLLELVVTMARSAVEAGGDPTEVLGANYSSFTELAQIEGEEELTAWLVAMLERMMDAIHSHHSYPIGVLISAAVKHMEEHLGSDLSRDEVAKVACLSPTHFSRVIKQTFGQSFTDLLAKMRVDKAREMLYLTERSIVQIGLDCGFSDQSYFTKVFKKHIGQTPGEYRRFYRAAI